MYTSVPSVLHSSSFQPSTGVISSGGASHSRRPSDRRLQGHRHPLPARCGEGQCRVTRSRSLDLAHQHEQAHRAPDSPHQQLVLAAGYRDQLLDNQRGGTPSLGVGVTVNARSRATAHTTSHATRPGTSPASDRRCSGDPSAKPSCSAPLSGRYTSSPTCGPWPTCRTPFGSHPSPNHQPRHHRALKRTQQRPGPAGEVGGSCRATG